MPANFNEEYIRDKNGMPQPLVDQSTSSGDGLTSVYFRNIEKKLINHITSADVVVGAVAWLTSRKVLEAYFSEWSQLTALSEPLDWESVSISPEWMIGDYAID